MSKPNYHITKFFTEHLLAIEMVKMQILMNKVVYLGLSKILLEFSEMLMYEFWYDHVKPKYCEKQNCVIWIPTVSLYT